MEETRQRAGSFSSGADRICSQGTLGSFSSCTCVLQALLVSSPGQADFYFQCQSQRQHQIPEIYYLFLIRCIFAILTFFSFITICRKDKGQINTLMVCISYFLHEGQVHFPSFPFNLPVSLPHLLLNPIPISPAVTVHQRSSTPKAFSTLIFHQLSVAK